MTENETCICGWNAPKAAAPWYTEAMEWAKNAGLMDGTRPNDPATRAELATVLRRLAARRSEK